MRGCFPEIRQRDPLPVVQKSTWGRISFQWSDASVEWSKAFLDGYITGYCGKLGIISPQEVDLLFMMRSCMNHVVFDCFREDDFGWIVYWKSSKAPESENQAHCLISDSGACLIAWWIGAWISFLPPRKGYILRLKGNRMCLEGMLSTRIFHLVYLALGSFERRNNTNQKVQFDRGEI